MASPPDADPRSIGPGNGFVASMSQAPALILAAPNETSRPTAAMAVRTTAADAALTSRDIFNRSFGVITVSENNELIGN